MRVESLGRSIIFFSRISYCFFLPLSVTDGTIRPKYSPIGPLNRNQHQPAFEFNVIKHRRRKVSNIGGGGGKV